MVTFWALAKRNVVLIGFFAVVLLLSIREPELISVENITQVLRQNAVAGIIAVGVTFVVVAGRLDLSVGSLLSLCVVMAVYLHDKIGPAGAVIATLAIGLIIGAMNGALVAMLGLNSLITTLGMLSILQGVTFVLLDGHSPIIFRPDATWFGIFGRSYIHGRQRRWSYSSLLRREWHCCWVARHLGDACTRWGPMRRRACILRSTSRRLSSARTSFLAC